MHGAPVPPPRSAAINMYLVPATGSRLRNPSGILNNTYDVINNARVSLLGTSVVIGGRGLLAVSQ